MWYRIASAVWFVITFPLLFIFFAMGDYEHSREWDKKWCICGHNYRKHEDRPERKRPINACNVEECDCRAFHETRMRKERP